MFKSLSFKSIGGILLVVGTSIGGGMLALPVANSQAGFELSSLYLCFVWAVSTFAAFLTLEVNLSLPPGSNMVSMARQTLGRFGEAIAWLAYCFLLFCLLSAYISGGADLLQSVLGIMGLNLPGTLSATIFVALLGSVVIGGIQRVDKANRGLMLSKLVLYIMFVILVIPNVHLPLLRHANTQWAVGSWMVLVTSFGFSIIVPSLRAYFADDIPELRRVMFIGSIIPLFCYIIWDFVIMGVIPTQGPNGLYQILQQGHETTALITALQEQLSNPAAIQAYRLFSSICMLTAFLGVSMALVDFLADGLQLQKRGIQGVILYSLTFLPALLIVVLYPGIFSKSLSYRGIFCVVLLILLPILMVWRGRYILKTIHGYHVMGGKSALIVMLIIATALTIVGIIVR